MFNHQKNSFRHFLKLFAFLVWYLLCGLVTLKSIAKTLSVCKILRNRYAFFSFVTGCTKKVGIIKCNFLQARCSKLERACFIFISKDFLALRPTVCHPRWSKTREAGRQAASLKMSSKMCWNRSSLLPIFIAIDERSRQLKYLHGSYVVPQYPSLHSSTYIFDEKQIAAPKAKE